MTELRKWKISDIWEWLGNAFLAIVEGQLLLRLNVSKYFVHILFTFLLFWVSIWLSLQIERTLSTVEDNRKTLSDIETLHIQKTLELSGYSRLSTMQEMLKASGSRLEMPVKPAERIK